jgi:predicted PurR-regulated permease PerM
MKKRKVPIFFSLLSVLFLLGGTLLILGVFLYASVEPLVHELPSYQTKFNSIVNNAASILSGMINNLELNIEQIDTKTLLGATAVTAEALTSSLQTFMDFLGKVGLVILFMLFMLSGTLDLHSKIRKAYPSDTATKINFALNEIGKKVRRFMAAKIILSGITGFLTIIILWILGVDFPFFWGFVAFLLSFIPQVGSVISVGLPVIFSILQFDSLTQPILVLVFLSILFTIAGSIIQPKIMAETLNLSPLLVLFGLIFWGILWGIWGMILAIPLTTTIKIIFENIESLKPISVLMGAKTN